MITNSERFIVRQRVPTAKGNLMIEVHNSCHYREAEMYYDYCLKNYSGDYVEFVKVETKETCINYTKDK